MDESRVQGSKRAHTMCISSAPSYVAEMLRLLDIEYENIEWLLNSDAMQQQQQQLLTKQQAYYVVHHRAAVCVYVCA